MNRPIAPVFFSSDHNYIMPTCVAILSMLQSSEDIYCSIYVLIDNSVLDKDKEILENTVESFDSEIHFIMIEGVMDGGYAFRGISKACYYRLLIPWLKPELKTAVYCDGDVVFTQSVRKLFEHSLGDKLVAAVHTPFYDSSDFARYCQDLNLKPSEYVNSGVLFINCDLMRKEEIKGLFMEHVGRKYYYQDQDIINLVCKDRIMYLSLEYNYPSYLFRATEAKPAIIHYSGPKPWKGFTNLWAYWWGVYEKSLVYDPDFECTMYKKILIPDYTFKSLLRLALRRVKRMISK